MNTQLSIINIFLTHLCSILYPVTYPYKYLPPKSIPIYMPQQIPARMRKINLALALNAYLYLYGYIQYVRNRHFCNLITIMLCARLLATR